MNRSTVRRTAPVPTAVAAGHVRLPSVLAVAVLAATLPLAAHAGLSYGQMSARDACPDPQFNACYIGVDGSSVATIDSPLSFAFVGLGVQSSELGAVTFPMAPKTSTAPVGNLTVESGASLTVSGGFSAARPYDVATVVGLGNNSTGVLNVSGGSVSTPILVIGQYDDTRPSTGTVTLFNKNNATNDIASTITATFDSGATGPAVGFTAIQIGRGAGSSGTLEIGYGDTVSAPNGSVSIGRAGSGTLLVAPGGTFSAAGGIYASSGDLRGTSMISVGGDLNVGGHLLLGIAADPSSHALDQGFLKESDVGGANHGNATLALAGGTVNGNVVIGKGGTLDGVGTIHGSVQNYGGYLSPGHSPGTIDITGDYLMDGGTYLVQIAGTGPGMTDFLDVGGMATLSNATILFQFIDGFSPSAGFTFDFLHAAGGVIASNLTFEEEGLAPGFEFATSTNDGAFAFTARTSGVAVVPEPASLALLAIGLVGVASRRRRRGIA